MAPIHQWKYLAAATALMCSATGTYAQSSVTLYGLIDLGVRASNHQGPKADNSLTTMKSGGTQPTRLGFRTVEDLGNGLKFVSLIETRFQATNGATDSSVNHYQQSYMGLQDAQYGTLLLGRNYNVLFDLNAYTFSPFKPMGPYLNSYKPEAGMLLGARTDQQIKYTGTFGKFTVAAQYGFGDTAFSTTSGKSMGATFKYANGGFGTGAGYLVRKDDAGRKARAYTAGAGYQTGALYLNASFTRNSFDDGLSSTLMLVGLGIDNAIVGSSPGQIGTRVDHRTLLTFGATYAFSSQFSLGGQYSRMQQAYHTPGAPDAKADFFAILATYSLSKRTDLYGTYEFTHLKNMQLTNASVTPAAPNGAGNRSTFMVGMRHRF